MMSGNYRMVEFALICNEIMNRNTTYWLLQIGGWLFYVLINLVFLHLNDGLDKRQLIGLAVIFIFGILYTHTFRYLIKRMKWISISLLGLIPRVIALTLAISTSIYLSHYFFEYLMGFNPAAVDEFSLLASVEGILNISFVVFFWPLIYFLVHFIDNYKKVEIEKLTWQASISEMELNKLKSQLNPHFMFNAMNSIRALIEENPERAKESVNQLSNILRNTLTMGKQKFILFEEEFKVVKDYLALEGTRYEERLQVEYNIDERSNQFMVPPLMLQTLVENGIKHGISKLKEGGKLVFSTRVEADTLHITIKNAGQLSAFDNSNTGLGLKNTRDRLALLYKDKAAFDIKNIDDKNVLTTIILHKNT